MKPLIRKSWYTLTEAADYLTRSTEGGPVTVSDVLQLAGEGRILISIRTFSATKGDTGAMVWLKDKTEGLSHDEQAELIHGPLTITSSDKIDLSQALPVAPLNEGPLNFVLDNDGGHFVKPGYTWTLSLYGWGRDLVNWLWNLSFTTNPNDLNRPANLPAGELSVNAPYTFREPAKELYFRPYPYEVDDEQWLLKIKWENVPEDTLLGLTTDELESLLSVSAAEGDIMRDDQLETTQHADGTETELRRTQRTLAALAIGLAGKHGTYSHGSKPNIKALAEIATNHLRDANGRTPHGFSDRTARDAITAALKACPDLLNDSDKTG